MSTKPLSAVAQVLARCHADLPWPQALLDDDCDVLLEWKAASGLVLSLFVDVDGSGEWAALIGDWASTGRFSVPGDWPAALVEAQQRYVDALAAREGGR